MMRKISLFVSALRSKLNFFCFLAFLPLVLIGYYKYVSGYSILGVLIPFYGFLLLFFKRDRLSLFPDAGRVQRFVGLVAILVSFFVYYAVIRFSSPDFYGVGASFYAIYILGLLLVFFTVPALRESLSVFFLVVAGGFSYYVGEWLKYQMEPLVPYFVRLMMFALAVLRIPATLHNPTVIVLNTSEGPVWVPFEAGCIGFYGFMVFSIIIVVMMMEESASLRTKLSWSLGGVVGAFVINIIRVSLISVVIYYFGYKEWGRIHAWIGYALFFLWLGFFFVIFSKREAIQSKIRVLWQKL